METVSFPLEKLKLYDIISVSVNASAGGSRTFIPPPSDPILKSSTYPFVAASLKFVGLATFCNRFMPMSASTAACPRTKDFSIAAFWTTNLVNLLKKVILTSRFWLKFIEFE